MAEGESREQAPGGGSTPPGQACDSDVDTPSQIAARRAALEGLKADGIPFVVAGAYAMREYTGVYRDTKDLDLFCKRSDQDRVLGSLARGGFRTERTDPLWIAKGYAEDGEFVDVIFSSGNGVAEVDDRWFSRARRGVVLGVPALLAPPEEIIWSKSFVMERERYDGADVQHLLRHCADFLDWRHLLDRMKAHVEVLLAHVVLFRFSFPADRDKVPGWVLDELFAASRAPAPPELRGRCRGTLLSACQYDIDLQEGLEDTRPHEVPAWRLFRGH